MPAGIRADRRTAAAILRNTLGIWLLFSSAYQYEELFGSMLRQLNSA